MIRAYKWWFALVTDWEARLDWALEEHGTLCGLILVGAVLVVEVVGMIALWMRIDN